MSEENKLISNETILSTSQPFATSTVQRKKLKPTTNENLIDLTSRTFGSDESLGIISIESDDGPYIDRLQLKEIGKGDTISYAKQQRALACQTLQNRESKISSLPSRFLRPSEMYSISDACINITNNSTVSESDILKQTGVNNTSTPKTSLSPPDQKIDVGESMARLSLELRNPDISLSTALLKMQQQFEMTRSSLQSQMFKPAEEAESRFLADEASWKREKELPADKVDFTVDNNFDASKLSISAFFKQRCEDISDMIPSGSGRSSFATNPSSISSVAEVSVTSDNELHDYANVPRNESMSVSKIAQILQEMEGTPTKVIDYLLNHCPGGKTQANSTQSSLSTDQQISISPIAGDKTDDVQLNYDKENINSMNIPEQNTLGKMSSSISKSLTSLRSTSSLSNLTGGKLPIETTHCELVWGCVKPGRNETKQFTLRNRSSNKLRLQCTVSGPLFRIMQERAEESSNSIKLMLHAHETKSISVIFNPLTIGAAADEILFSPCDPHLLQTKKQSIKLFGYGGVGNIEFKKNILKDSTGRHWLSLGNVFGQSVISENIQVYNKGSLPAFAFFNYFPKDFAFSKVSINPEIIILGPNEQKDINISCKVTSADMKFLHNSMVTSVFETGTVKIVSGPEALRGRIRRVCKLAMERHLEMDSLSKRLQQEIKGEAIPTDVIKCRESVNSLKSLLQGLSQREVVIMVEKDMDSTLVPALTDDTSEFQSLCNNSTIMDETVVNRCVLEPSSIILTPPSKLQDFIFLVSGSDSSLRFEVSAPRGLEITPQAGYVTPHATEVIEVKIKNLDEIVQSVFNVSVNIEGDVLLTKVKIIFI